MASYYLSHPISVLQTVCTCFTTTGKYTFEIIAEAASLPKVWNKYADNTSQTERLLALEKANFPGVSFRYVLVRQGERVLGGFYFQLHEVSSNKFRLPENDGQVSVFAKYWFGVPGLKLLVMGNLFHQSAGFWEVGNSGLETGFGETMPDWNLILKKVLKAVRKETKPDFVLLKDINLMPFFSSFNPKGAIELPNDIVMEMEIVSEWKGLDCYNNSLSRKYAARVRKTRSAMESIVIKDLEELELQAKVQTIERLYCQVIDKAKVQLTRINATYLLGLKQAWGENFILKGYFLNNELVGFSSFLISEKQVEIFAVGYEVEANKHYQLYHNMLLGGLEMAIIFKKQNLFLGRTAWEAKAILGAKPVFQHHKLLVKNPLLRLAAKNEIKRTPSPLNAAWKDRNPFR